MGGAEEGVAITSHKLIARDRELQVLLHALDPDRAGARAVVLEGEPGIGKTALWRRALEEAPKRGFAAALSAPAASEARLAFAALGDLLDFELDGAVKALPAPQRAALEIALLQREGDLGDSEAGERLIGLATLGILRAIAARTPLVMAGELARQQRRLAHSLERPWVLALAARCEALVACADGDADGAKAAFEWALEDHARQDRPLDRARTLLAYGTVLRRQRSKRAAREALEQARQTFEGAGAGLWAARARQELGRIGGRRAASSGELSATEAAIAKLVAAGATNQEVAQALHLTARTVEWNLSKLYRKLGVRSRIGAGQGAAQRKRKRQLAA